MVIALVIVALVVILTCLYGIVRPVVLIGFARRFLVSPGIWAASGIRVLLAVLLWFTATSSQTPGAFKVLAFLALVAAIAILVAGKARLMKLLERLETWPALAIRTQMVVGLFFGAFLWWSLWPAVGGSH